MNDIDTCFVRRAMRKCVRYMEGYRHGLFGPTLDYAVNMFKQHRNCLIQSLRSKKNLSKSRVQRYIRETLLLVMHQCPFLVSSQLICFACFSLLPKTWSVNVPVTVKLMVRVNLYGFTPEMIRNCHFNHLFSTQGEERDLY